MSLLVVVPLLVTVSVAKVILELLRLLLPPLMEAVKGRSKV